MRTAIERGGPFGGPAVDALAYAEAQGAAPGTEFPGSAPAESSPLGRRTAKTPAQRGAAALAVLFLAAAAGFGGHAAWLHAKAALGQHLLARAWATARATHAAAKPWPWADTHPVARLRAPAQGVDLLVLSGANGRTLAWGPGHVEGTAAPGERGNAVVTGHRDTHFAFLARLRRGRAASTWRPRRADAALSGRAHAGRRQVRAEAAGRPSLDHARAGHVLPVRRGRSRHAAALRGDRARGAVTAPANAARPKARAGLARRSSRATPVPAGQAARR